MLAVMQVTERCNLRCHYCYLPTASQKDMPMPLAFGAMRILADIARQRRIGRGLSICFHGGEPTLILPRVKKMIAHARGLGINEFIIATNGVGLDQKTVNFIVENRISIILSIDGVAPAHDHQRVFPDGSGSWLFVDRALDLLSEHAATWAASLQRNPFRFRVTMTPATIPYLARTVRYLSSKPIGRFGYITLVPGNYKGARWPKDRALLKVLKGQVADIRRFFQECDRAGLPRPRVSLNECLSAELTRLDSVLKPRKSSFCAPGDKVMGVSIDGRIYACHLCAVNCHEPANDPFCVGTVQAGLQRALNGASFTTALFNAGHSCFYWNRKESGNLELPTRACEALAEAWYS